jgi:hypothetical protein
VAREIIDFGPANTLLHYKDTRTQTIDLTDAEPDAMANLLADDRPAGQAGVVEHRVHPTRPAATTARR